MFISIWYTVSQSTQAILNKRTCCLRIMFTELLCSKQLWNCWILRLQCKQTSSRYMRRNWEKETPCFPIFKEFPLVLSGRENKIKTQAYSIHRKLLDVVLLVLGIYPMTIHLRNPIQLRKSPLIYPLNYKFAFLWMKLSTVAVCTMKYLVHLRSTPYKC